MKHWFCTFKSYYAGMSKAAKAAFWFTFCSCAEQGISFITVPVFTRLLSAGEYGIWTLYQAWKGIFSVIIVFHLSGGGFNNAMIKYEKEKDSYVSSMIGLAFCLISIWFLFIAVFRDKISNFTDLKWEYLFIMLGDIFMNLVFALWSQYKKFYYEYKALLAITLALSVLLPACGIFAVIFAEDGITARIVANLAVEFTFSIILMYVLFKKGKRFFSLKYWKFALCFNIPLVPHYLSQIILNQSDRLMIGRICGESQAAFYSVAYSIANVVIIIMNSISAALCPWLYRRIKERNFCNIAETVNKLAMFFAILAGILILLAPEVIGIMGPKEYQSAVWVIPPVASSVYFLFLYGMYANVEFYYEKKGLVAVGSVGAAVVNVVLNMIFIQKYGFIAAGYTTVFCYAGYAVCHCIFSNYVQKKAGIKAIFDNRFLLLNGGAVLLIMILGNFLYLNTIARYLVLVGIMFLCWLKRGAFIGALSEVRGKSNE